MIIFLFWEDLIFLLAGGIGLILLLYLINDGQFRVMAIVGLACGFLVWRVTAGHLMSRVSEKLVFLIRKLLKVALRYVALPFHQIGKWLYSRCILPLKRAMAEKRVRKQILATQQVIQNFQLQAEQVFFLSALHDENTKK